MSTHMDFLAIVRELVRCYQAFEGFSARHTRTQNLTPAQFDIIATLGNTDGMSCKDLGEKTLITKGTLTGVVDRLIDKKLVRRIASPSDGRSQIVQLTAKGAKLFTAIFPAHLDHMRRPFSGFSQADLQQTEAVLRNLRSTFENHLEEA